MTKTTIVTIRIMDDGPDRRWWESLGLPDPARWFDSFGPNVYAEPLVEVVEDREARL